MSTNTLLLAILFVLVGALTFLVIRIELRLARLFKGSGAKSLEPLLQEIVKRVAEMEDGQDVHEGAIENIRTRLAKEGRGVALMRFNPFKDVGGTQSFAVAIVNEEGDGVVFSSLYSRERMSVFAKPVQKGTSDIELSEEESTVIENARKSIAK